MMGWKIEFLRILESIWNISGELDVVSRTDKATRISPSERGFLKNFLETLNFWNNLYALEIFQKEIQYYVQMKIFFTMRILYFLWRETCKDSKQLLYNNILL